MKFQQLAFLVSTTGLLVSAFPQALPTEQSGAVDKIVGLEHEVEQALAELDKFDSPQSHTLERAVEQAKELEGAVKAGDAETADKIVKEQEQLYQSEIRPQLLEKLGEDGLKQFEAEVHQEAEQSKGDISQSSNNLEKRFLDQIPFGAIMEVGAFIVKGAVRLVGMLI